MILGICNLSIVPVRIEDSDKSEMINQLIYGDIIEILEEKEKWVKIKSLFDDYIVWIDKKQYYTIDVIFSNQTRLVYINFMYFLHSTYFTPCSELENNMC